VETPAGALTLPLVAAAVVALAGQTQGSPVVLVESAGVVHAVHADGKRERIARGGDPSLSADGRRVAFVRDGTVYVLERASGRVARVAQGREPAWGPDGRLAYTASDGVRIGARLVTPGASGPAWAADGRLAIVLPDGIWVAGALAVPGGRSPAWGPEGRLAYVMEDGVHVDGSLVIAGGRQPAWDGAGRLTAVAPDGIVAEGGGLVAGTRAGDAAPSWGNLTPKPSPERDPNQLLPDLDQRAPSGLSIVDRGGSYRLGFTSATDNVGRGPLWIRGRRPDARRLWMRADQVIELRSGGTHAVREVGEIRFVSDSPHHHWHLMRFQRFELRRASDFKLLVRDRKTGFCLGDHYGLARSRVSGFRGPRFFGGCGQHERGRLTIEMGTSIGYTDRYPAHFHGQNVDITGVPGGIYVLVHRANPSGRIRELRYDNNAASLRIRIAWPNGRKSPPTVRVLRTCEGSERC
jgi:hypothetical protein